MYAHQTQKAAARSPGPHKPPAASRRASPDVRAILRGPIVQPKLKIGAANDPAEAEADAVADKVIRMSAPEPSAAAEGPPPPGNGSDSPPAMPPSNPGSGSGPNPIRRMCNNCEGEIKRQPIDEKDELEVQRQPIDEEKDELEVQRMTAGEGGEVDEEELIQPKEVPGAAPALSAASESAIRGLGGGAPLAPAERVFFEPRFGRDFSDVRIHSDAAADQSARSINARAFTLGSDIAFARGEYTPGSPTGRRLLAHELTHAVQQMPGSKGVIARQGNDAPGMPVPERVLEREQAALGRLGGNVDSNVQIDTGRPEQGAIQSSTFEVTTTASGSHGSITTTTQINLIYDPGDPTMIVLRPLNIIGSEEGVGTPREVSAYPIRILYNRIVAYTDSDGRAVEVNMFGNVHFSHETWSAQSLSREPTFEDLQQMRGDYGAIYVDMSGSSAIPNFAYSAHYAARGSSLSIQTGQAEAMLPFGAGILGFNSGEPARFLDLDLPGGEQFASLRAFLVSADALELERRLERAKENEDTAVSGTLVKGTEESWLSGVLSALGGLISELWNAVPAPVRGVLSALAQAGLALAAILGLAALIVFLSPVELAIATVALVIGGILLVAGFISAILSRSKEARLTGEGSTAAVVRIALLDAVGVSMVYEAITDKSMLSGIDLDRPPEERWEQGTLGAIQTIATLVGIRAVLKRTPLYVRPTETADPSLGPGEGATDPFTGNIRYSPHGPAAEQALVLHHERVHSFFSPHFNILRNFRARLRMSAYERSSLLRYAEEAMAETYAQLRVRGLRGVPEGVRFPITEGYVYIARPGSAPHFVPPYGGLGMAQEAVIGTIVIGGVAYTVHVIVNNALHEEKEPEIQRKTADELDEEELVQPKEVPGAAPALSAASESAIRGLGGGAPLAKSERVFFEPRFGRDFSDVRIHSDATADQSARSINARAYTLGSNIAFAGGEYAPGTPAGRRLMAHELAHVGQQGGRDQSATLRRQILPESEFILPEPEWRLGPSPEELAGQRAVAELAHELASDVVGGFELDSAELSEEQRSRVARLATIINMIRFSHPFASVVVIGHTDLAGSESHNESLGRRRAAAVRQALITNSVPEDIISEPQSQGELSPIVETQRAEVRNRRVDVSFSPGPNISLSLGVGELTPPTPPDRHGPVIPPPGGIDFQLSVSQICGRSVYKMLGDKFEKELGRVGLPSSVRDFFLPKVAGAVEAAGDRGASAAVRGIGLEGKYAAAAIGAITALLNDQPDCPRQLADERRRLEAEADRRQRMGPASEELPEAPVFNFLDWSF